jgi:long-subunit fatty acid transport protein
MIFKPKALSMAMVAICSAGSVVAGGADVTLMPTEMMFEKGNYAEVSSARVRPNVKGSLVAPTGSMYPDYSANTLALKMEVNDKLSIGFADYLSAVILVDYRKAGASGFPAAVYSPAFVDLEIRSRLLAVKYQANDNVSILGGLKLSKTSNATANVLKNPKGNLSIPSATGSALALGLAYEKPEIALRVSALYQSATKFDLPMTSDQAGFGTLANGKAGLPKSMTLRFQSGIAKDTLVFGSAHRGDWAKSQVEFDTDNGGATAPTGTLAARSSFTTTTAYTLGLGRKLSEKYAVSATYGWEKGSAVGTSLLSTTGGKKSLSLGGKYTTGPLALSVGYSRVRFGDYTCGPNCVMTSATPTFEDSNFVNNTASVFGVKIGLSF